MAQKFYSKENPEISNSVGGSKISNTEWGLLIGALAVIDGIQFCLDWLAVGVIINRFIDLIVGMALPFYLYLRGVKLTAKKAISMACAFVGEIIPVVDALPLWTADAILLMTIEKAEKALNKTPMVGKIAKSTVGKTVVR
jgi:hypothetical protein